LKKKVSKSQSFWLMGQPDIELKKADDVRYIVEVHGFDYYNTMTHEIESGDASRIAMWMLDTDYDGRSLYPQQVFFPMAGDLKGWTRITRSLKAYIDETLLENYHGTVSLPFELGPNKRIAVKIVDDRGIESLRILKAK
jgi:adenine-specific DNA-methyltransferase